MPNDYPYRNTKGVGVKETMVPEKVSVLEFLMNSKIKDKDIV